tara:strand:- start:3055 stop:3465 length:411 start_codon:yes stop_codon:yes gene_type:complete
MTDYYSKYLKYKNKYLKLKKNLLSQVGGVKEDNKLRMTYVPGYGMVLTTLSKEDQAKQIKTVMAYVPNQGWVLTSMFDLNPSKDGKDLDKDGDEKTKYYYIPGRGVTVHNPKISGLFSSFIPINQLKYVGAMPNIL